MVPMERQYLFLGLLFVSPFSLSGHVNAGSSLIRMRTWSSRVFNGVKLAVLLRGGLDLWSSFLSLVWANFLPLSGQGSSCFSLLFRLLPRAIMASLVFMYFVARYSMSAVVYWSFLYKEKKIPRIGIHLWKPWPRLYRQLRQSKMPLYWSELHMTLSSRRLVVWYLVGLLRIFYISICQWNAWWNVCLIPWKLR